MFLCQQPLDNVMNGKVKPLKTVKLPLYPMDETLELWLFEDWR